MNLLFVTFDTLRSDHLGCYGYDRDTSPWKLIVNPDERRVDLPPKELYDLEADPLEVCNLAAAESAIAADLTEKLDRFVADKIALRQRPADPLMEQEVGCELLRKQQLG